MQESPHGPTAIRLPRRCWRPCAPAGTEEKCTALKAHRVDSGAFGDSERALIALTDQSTRHLKVDAETIAEVQRHFGETGAVEAVATAAAYNMVSRFLVALAI